MTAQFRSWAFAKVLSLDFLASPQQSVIVSEMSKNVSCSAWNKDISAADCHNTKFSLLICFPIITDELITAAVLKHSNSKSNNISKDVIEEWIKVLRLGGKDVPAEKISKPVHYRLTNSIPKLLFIFFE